MIAVEGLSIRQGGFALDARTQLLFSEAGFHLNGEALPVPPDLREALAELAHRRRLPPGGTLPPALLALLHDWYGDGFGRPG